MSNEFELCVFSSTTDGQISPRSENTPSCWHCVEENARILSEMIELQNMSSLKDIKIDPKGNLIRPCTCENKFIHVHCLELLGNTRQMLDCPHCCAQYPLKMQRKSLLKMFQEVYGPAFMIFFLIFLNFINSLIVYVVMSINAWNLISIIVKIIMLNIFFVLIYMTALKIIDWSKRIYKLYDQWYNSTEWKLIKQYVNIDNI